MENQVWLQNLTWEEVKQKTRECKGTIILPVGSTEQHGPHLPVGTDTMVANSVAEGAALKANVLVAPPLWFGWSPHHLVLPGTITIRAEVLIEIVYDMMTSLHRHAFLTSAVKNVIGDIDMSGAITSSYPVVVAFENIARDHRAVIGTTATGYAVISVFKIVVLYQSVI